MEVHAIMPWLLGLSDGRAKGGIQATTQCLPFCFILLSRLTCCAMVDRDVVSTLDCGTRCIMMCDFKYGC